MDADLDTLATALYVRTDDLLKASPERVPWRPKVGIAPKITDAELITLAVMQALLGHTSEARWLRHARSHLRELFPYLPQQPGYNKRVGARNAAHVTRPADIRGAVRRVGRAVGRCSSRLSSAGGVVVRERPGRVRGVAGGCCEVGPGRGSGLSTGCGCRELCHGL